MQNFNPTPEQLAELRQRFAGGTDTTNNKAPYLDKLNQELNTLSRYGMPTQQPKRREISDEEITKKIDKQTLFLFAFVPFVIAEIAWDYADSCIDLAILQRIHETKRLCRRIRELRREYDRMRSKFIDAEHRAIETDNMLAFQDDYKAFFSKLNINIKGRIDIEHPGLCYDSKLLISGAYSYAVVLKAMFKYVNIMEKRIAQLLGVELTGTIIINELRELSEIILQFAGEDSIGNNNKFPAMLQPFADTLTNYLLQSEYIELPCPIVTE